MEQMPSSMPEERNLDDEQVEQQSIENQHGMHVDRPFENVAEEQAYDKGIIDDKSVPEAGPVKSYFVTPEQAKEPTAPSVESEAPLGDQAEKTDEAATA